MTITVILTNARHLAAAEAMRINSGDGETATEFAQRAFNRLADEWAERSKVDQISVGEFVLRFTGAEFSAITSSADPNVAGILATLRARDSVRLGSPDAVNGIAYLVGAGLLTQERAAVVLAY